MFVYSSHLPKQPTRSISCQVDRSISCQVDVGEVAESYGTNEKKESHYMEKLQVHDWVIINVLCFGLCKDNLITVN